MLAPVPQSARQPVTLPDDEVRRLLRRRRPADRADLYATDASPDIRTLGLLALRRSDINDLFALGDMCARRVLTDDGRLRVFYVGKVLAAYQKALQTAVSDDDRALARHMIAAFCAWTAQAAREYPTPRNIAAALWALAEDGSTLPITEAELRALLAVYSSGLKLEPPVDEAATRTDADQELTAADASLSYLLSQSQATMLDAAVNADTVYSQHDNDPDAPLEDAAQPVVLTELTSVERDPGSPLHELDILKRRRLSRADDEFHQGDRIEGRYEVADVRRGGMGVVYLCYDHDQHEPVAIKSFQARFLENERAVIRFYNEAHTWIRLEKHRHIVQARLVQNINNRPYIILEHISGPEGLGPDLKSWIDHHRLSTIQAVEFGLHIALGMQHAARQVPGLVHRDLKPANILVTHDAIAKVTDFGLVRSVEGDSLRADDLPINTSPDTQLTRVGAIVGTAPYMSPEQCRSQRVDLRSDIYAFGCLLYEMLTGKPVFDVRKFADWIDAHLHRAPFFSPRQSEALPAALRELALVCLEKRPENRPASWSEIVEALSVIYTSVTGKPAVMEATGPTLEARELMDKGYSLTELGHLDEALEAYDRAITLKPDYAWAWARKGRTLRLLSRFDDALACYDHALALQPRYAFAWNGKGIVLERMGQPEQALICYETAAQINPTDVWHWCNQADVLQSLGRLREAVALLEKALRIDPAHPNSWAKLGQMLRLLNEYEESIHAYEQAIHLDPEYAWAHNGYGLSLRALGRLPEALTAFKRAAQYQPEEVWHWYNITETLIDLKQYQDAVYTAQQATRTDPAHSHSWSKLGQVLRYVRRYDEALEAYNRAIALQPDYDWALNGKGMVLEALNRLDEALACYQQAAQYDQQEAWHTYYNQGNILVKLRRYAEALPLLEQAVAVNPGHARGWARLGSALRNLRRLDEALDAFRQATRQAPAYAWAWNEKGITFEALGRPEEALRCYRQAAAAAPHDPLYVYQQADVLVYMNQYAPALELLEQALLLDSRSARVWAKHGQVLRRLNRFPEALRSYTRAVELDADYAWAWNGRGLTLSALDMHEDALECFRRAAEVEPQDVWYWYNQGDELVILERMEAALALLDRALTVDPRHPESWAKRGQALRRLRRWDEALQAYDQALQVNPRYDWAWNGRGLVLQALGKREEALASYQRASHEDPAVVLYYTNQADVLLEMQRREEALAVIEQALAVQPDNPNAWARHGQVLRRLGDNDGAIESYQRALALDDSYAWAWNGQGLAYAAEERWSEALACYELAVHYNDADPWFWYNFGEARFMLGDYAEAARAFERALALDPQHEPSQARLLQARAKLDEDNDD